MKGISSHALTEQIWGGEASSKNSKSLRSVSILKLRKILERLDQVEILFASNRYLLRLSPLPETFGAIDQRSRHVGAVYGDHQPR